VEKVVNQSIYSLVESLIKSSLSFTFCLCTRLCLAFCLSSLHPPLPHVSPPSQRAHPVLPHLIPPKPTAAAFSPSPSLPSSSHTLWSTRSYPHQRSPLHTASLFPPPLFPPCLHLALGVILDDSRTSDDNADLSICVSTHIIST
jgi:hypothetical protein